MPRWYLTVESRKKTRVNSENEVVQKHFVDGVARLEFEISSAAAPLKLAATSAIQSATRRRRAVAFPRGSMAALSLIVSSKKPHSRVIKSALQWSVLTSGCVAETGESLVLKSQQSD